MKNQADYSLYKCPYEHIEKDCGHELKGPEGYENTYSVWCACGFRGPVFCLDPIELKLEKIHTAAEAMHFKSRCTNYDTFVCPDGVTRSHNEIADYLGIPRSTWNARFYNHGLEEAFKMESRGPYNTGAYSAAPQLSRIPSPTSYEEMLYG
jgi:hypothetical protein